MRTFTNGPFGQKTRRCADRHEIKEPFRSTCVTGKEEIMTIYGYIRVSSTDQNEDRQVIAMRNLRISRKNIFIDKQSGKDFDRPMYQKMVKKLQCDDLIYIKSIDRLGRNYNEVVEQWQYLTHVKRVDIVVIEMPLLDTRRGKDLLGTFLSDVVLQILSFVAENDRNNIRSRQREGIDAAREKGVRFGRPPMEMPKGFMEIYRKWKIGAITAQQAADQCGCSRSTFYSRARKIGRGWSKK